MTIPQRRKTSLFATIRTDIQAAILEFCGTFLFLLLGLGGIQASAESNQASLQAAKANAAGRNRTGEAINTVASIEQLLYISVSMGLSLLISVWLFYRVTGGIFNPAVSTALFIIGAIGPVRWALCCIAQLLGAIAASGVLLALLPNNLAVNTVPGPGVNSAQAVFIEMFLTSALVLSVLMLAAEKHRSTPFAPIGVGLTLFAGHLFGVIYTGASMNTARQVHYWASMDTTCDNILHPLGLSAPPLCPALIVRTGFTGLAHSWEAFWQRVSTFCPDSLVITRLMGFLLTIVFYIALKNMQYWTLNPGQESANFSNSPANPLDKFRRPSATDAEMLQVPSMAVPAMTAIGTEDSAASAPRTRDFQYTAPQEGIPPHAMV